MAPLTFKFLKSIAYEEQWKRTKNIAIRTRKIKTMMHIYTVFESVMWTGHMTGKVTRLHDDRDCGWPKELVIVLDGHMTLTRQYIARWWKQHLYFLFYIY